MTDLHALAGGRDREDREDLYREVLSIDPGSRIFLPFARLLMEKDKPDEAAEVLRKGLAANPEFLEARLFLIDVLHAAGRGHAAAVEASGLIQAFTDHPAFWKVWSKSPGVRPDQEAMLLFFSAALRSEAPASLSDVFEAGIRAVSDRTSGTISAPAPRTAGECTDSGTFCGQPSTEQASGTAPAGNAFTMPPGQEWTALDSVPEDDDLDDDAAAGGAELPAAPSDSTDEAPPEARDAETAREEDPPRDADCAECRTASPARPEEALPSQGKTSLCTRTMAQLLADQGAAEEAAGIYRELLLSASSPEEQAELNEKILQLSQNADGAADKQPALVDMLQKLAERLENRSRAETRRS